MLSSEIRIFIVIGRTGHSLILSKALPFAALEDVKEIIIFSETEGFATPKVRYITIPSWIRKINATLLGRSIRFIYEPLQLLYYTLKLKPDIINGVYCLPKGINSLIAAKLTSTKCIISVIGSRLEIETELPFRKMWELINLWQLRYCNAIAIKGKTDRDYLISKKIDPLKMFTLNGAIDTEKFYFANGERSIDILFAGTFYELKGPDRFIRIVQELIQYFPDLKVSMIGTGKMLNDTKKMVEDLEIDHFVRFEGYQKDPIPFFQQSKILVMPSRSESLSTAMLEAMACGCVPVVSDVGNVREAALHSINAKIIGNYLDIDSFVISIRDLLQHEVKRKQFAHLGRLQVEKYFSIKGQSKMAMEMVDYLKII